VQRRDEIDALAGDPKRLAGRQYPHVGAAAQHGIHDHRRGSDEVFAVVQDE